MKILFKRDGEIKEIIPSIVDYSDFSLVLEKGICVEKTDILKGKVYKERDCLVEFRSDFYNFNFEINFIFPVFIEDVFIKKGDIFHDTFPVFCISLPKEKNIPSRSLEEIVEAEADYMQSAARRYDLFYPNVKYRANEIDKELKNLIDKVERKENDLLDLSDKERLLINSVNIGL